MITGNQRFLTRFLTFDFAIRASGHLCDHCQHVPKELRSQLLQLKERKSSAGGGKKYWADGVRILGVYEDEDGLRFTPRR